jgi:hypothetical protein
VFENRVLRRIFGPERKEVAGGWRRLRNEELHNLYVSPSIIKVTKSRRMRWVGHVARIGEMKNIYKTLVEKPEEKRLPVKSGRRWEHTIKMKYVGRV